MIHALAANIPHIDYKGLSPLIAVVGWWLYSEPLDIFVFAGAGLIISGMSL